MPFLRRKSVLIAGAQLFTFWVEAPSLTFSPWATACRAVDRERNATLTCPPTSGCSAAAPLPESSTSLIFTPSSSK